MTIKKDNVGSSVMHIIGLRIISTQIFRDNTFRCIPVAMPPVFYA